MSAFASAAMAEGYANARPPVHPEVIAKVKSALKLTTPVARALDVGCGAGISTRPLTRIAETVLGLEPAVAMLPYAAAIAPQALFAAGRAESLPVQTESIDLMTAAGSLNYADLDRFFPEAGRVLRPEGTLVVYDFSQGRSFVTSGALDTWFAAFQERYPPPVGDARPLDPEILRSIHGGWRVFDEERFEIALRLTPEFYTNYAMTETNVATAIARGRAETEIRDWCCTTIPVAFEARPRDVLFRGYIAYMSRV